MVENNNNNNKTNSLSFLSLYFEREKEISNSKQNIKIVKLSKKKVEFFDLNEHKNLEEWWL